MPSQLLSEWEQARESEEENKYLEIFKKIEEEFHLDGIQKVLWK